MISSKSDRLSAQPPWKKWKPTIQKAPQKTFFHMKFRPKWEFDPENVNKQKELPQALPRDRQLKELSDKVRQHDFSFIGGGWSTATNLNNYTSEIVCVHCPLIP